MNKKIFFNIAVFLFTVAISLSFSLPSHAERRVAGTLKCKVKEGVSFIFGSSRDLRCIYEPVRGGEVERYTGTIKKFGIDIGYQRSGVILWQVLSPTTKYRPGIIEGDYVGATAQVTAGAGVGANALIGTNKIMLNPLSVSGSTGLNIAAGVADIELRYVGRLRK